MDKYVKVKKIGEGSFGKALLVRSKDNGKQMVVKEINMCKMGHKEREEARKETAVLAQLHHPNIVMYRESFEEVGNLYIVMDYCDGGDLYSRINLCRGILMQEDQILDMFVQLCLSIKHIHDRKILHRDIKSQNIFLTKHGIVKLGDFGIAKVLNSTVELARTCIGTPYYLSPEIVENKPYNNKSDIWSLGCVLYEMTTLKHAFEAGNMKNLVLKIIRGSYPPVPSKYSYELRSLIAQLFKRNARDRPSVNAILRKPLLQNRIKRFLTDNEISEEFSHTVMHGQKIKKALPPGQNHPQPVRASSAVAKKPPSTPRYNPASVYAPSVARKSREGQPNKARKSVESNARKSSDSGARKPSDGKRPAGGVVAHNAQNELAKRRQELISKEKQRQEAAKLKEQQYARQHQELIERQKVSRMNKAREDGWKNLLGSDDSDVANKGVPNLRKEGARVVGQAAVPIKPSVQPSGVGKEQRGDYEHYHQFLDKLEQERRVAAGIVPTPVLRPSPVDPPGRVAGMAPTPALRPTPVEPPGAHGAGVAPSVSPQSAAAQGQAAGARGAEAAKRAKILEEYIQRKREAALYKARGAANMHGRGVAGAVAPGAAPSSAKSGGNADAAAAAGVNVGRPVSAREAHRQQQEQEYMARLKQIRLHNFNERRGQQAQGPAKAQVPDAKSEQEVRKKKVEALRAQAEERAQRLKSDLERKRREAYELEQQRLRAQAKAKARPIIPMTDAMKAIGASKDKPPTLPAEGKGLVGMTAAMAAIGAGPTPENRKSPLQRKKEEILKRLNAKPQASKWAKPMEPLAVQPERSRWSGAGAGGDLSNLSLEETASQMEETSVRDRVIRHGGASPEMDPQPASRRQWGSPAGTVLNALQGAELCEVDSSLGSSGGSEKSASGGGKGIGTTITISQSRNPNKGTQVIAKVPDALAEEDETEETDDQKPAGDKTVSPTKQGLQAILSPSSSSTLFDRVQLDEDEGDEERKKEDDIVLEEFEPEEKEQKKGTAKVMKHGLCTGQFDIGDVKLLRTCSEPDLSKLFRTDISGNMFLEDAKVHGSFDAGMVSQEEAGEEEEKTEEESEGNDEVGSEVDSRDGLQDEREKSGEEEDRTDAHSDDKSLGTGSDDRDVDEVDKEIANDDDDEDLQTVRESMMSLLEDDDEDIDEDGRDSTLVPTKKKTKKGTKKTKMKMKKKKGRSVKDIENSLGDGDGSCSASNLMRSESAEDIVTMHQTMRDVLLSVAQGKEKKPAKGLKSGAGDGEIREEKDEEITSTILPGTESWQSDDDEDYFEEEDDMFSRLEENRVKLEQELGCDTFLKAYKTVQGYQQKAIHEDEDENMEEGIRLVSGILGDNKAHLYPAILQLVMADGVFMEDNS